MTVTEEEDCSHVLEILVKLTQLNKEGAEQVWNQLFLGRNGPKYLMTFVEKYT